MLDLAPYFLPALVYVCRYVYTCVWVGVLACVWAWACGGVCWRVYGRGGVCRCVCVCVLVFPSPNFQMFLPLLLKK